MTFDTFDQSDAGLWPWPWPDQDDRDNPDDLWHLRHWLQCWQLRTWTHNNLFYLTIKSDTGQHSQFLRCFLDDFPYCIVRKSTVSSEWQGHLLSCSGQLKICILLIAQEGHKKTIGNTFRLFISESNILQNKKQPPRCPPLKSQLGFFTYAYTEVARTNKTIHMSREFYICVLQACFVATLVALRWSLCLPSSHTEVALSNNTIYYPGNFTSVYNKSHQTAETLNQARLWNKKQPPCCPPLKSLLGFFTYGGGTYQ